MSAVARPVAVRALGDGRWRVELVLDVATADDPLPHPHPRSVVVRPLAGDVAGARVETVIAPRSSTRGRFGVVVATDRVEGGAVELRGDGWAASVALTASEEPAPLHPRAAPPVPTAVDYRARDFDALRTMLSGVIDEHLGAGLDDHPVAQTEAIVEQLAYLGDALSYSQDAVATEAYLETARRRISVTRHAALLDYAVFEGRSARTWLRFETEAPVLLPARTQALARAPGLPARVAGVDVPAARAAGALVFETLEDVELQPPHGTYVLADGGTLAVGAVGATFAGPCPALLPGGLVLLEPTGRDTGFAPAAHVVRLVDVRRDLDATHVTWGQEDAVPAGSPLVRRPLRALAGNLVLADHGTTIGWTPLPAPEPDRRFWPALAARPAFSAGVGPDDARRSAAAALAGTGRTVRAAVEIRESEVLRWHTWTQRDSLLESGPLATDFVVEVEDDDPSRVRFGDGTNGMRPPLGARFEARIRAGGGTLGNVGPGAIAHVVTDAAAVRSVRNPVAATGGEEPETLAGVRVNAPRVFRATDRAVSPAEYRAAALGVTGVADATAIVVGAGAGPLASVRVHTGDWSVPAAPVVERVRRALERLRPAGVALDVRGARALPATVALDVTVRTGWTLAALSSDVGRVVRGRLLRPGAFGFGTALHHSELVALVAAMPGVTDVTVARMDWVGGTGSRETLEPPFGSIVRLDDDVAHPEHGALTFRLRTGAA